MSSSQSVAGQGTGVWYCPNCGYVDPQTHNTHCPKCSRSPLFREANFGYYIRVGPEEARSADA
jgi:RNA polymerase subunit RPABC4/transcription elongation factor Spt4